MSMRVMKTLYRLYRMHARFVGTRYPFQPILAYPYELHSTGTCKFPFVFDPKDDADGHPV